MWTEGTMEQGSYAVFCHGIFLVTIGSLWWLFYGHKEAPYINIKRKFWKMTLILSCSMLSVVSRFVKTCCPPYFQPSLTLANVYSPLQLNVRAQSWDRLSVPVPVSFRWLNQNISGKGAVNISSCRSSLNSRITSLWLYLISVLPSALRVSF